MPKKRPTVIFKTAKELLEEQENHAGFGGETKPATTDDDGASIGDAHNAEYTESPL